MPTDFPTLNHLRPQLATLIADQFDHFFRTIIATDDSYASDTCFRYITREPSPFGNLALFRPTATPDSIAADLEPLLSGDFPSGALLMDNANKASRDTLTDHGFVHGEFMDLMAVSPETLAPMSLAEGYTFHECSLDEADAWAVAVSDGYGLPRPVGGLFGMERFADRCPEGTAKHFAVEHEGALVATSLIYFHEGVAGIYGVATLPEHRGNGLAGHLTAQPLRLAFDLGYETGILQASEMGKPVYERLGFESFGRMSFYVKMPAD